MFSVELKMLELNVSKAWIKRNSNVNPDTLIFFHTVNVELSIIIPTPDTDIMAIGTHASNGCNTECSIIAVWNDDWKKAMTAWPSLYWKNVIIGNVIRNCFPDIYVVWYQHEISYLKDRTQRSTDGEGEERCEDFVCKTWWYVVYLPWDYVTATNKTQLILMSVHIKASCVNLHLYLT